MNAEGWYKDPYGLHEERWFSDGTATALVRDGQVERTDAPPDAPPPEPLIPAEPRGTAHGAEDLLRVDDVSRDVVMDQTQATAMLEAVVAPVPLPDRE